MCLSDCGVAVPLVFSQDLAGTYRSEMFSVSYLYIYLKLCMVNCTVVICAKTVVDSSCPYLWGFWSTFDQLLQAKHCFDLVSYPPLALWFNMKRPVILTSGPAMTDELLCHWHSGFKGCLSNYPVNKCRQFKNVSCTILIMYLRKFFD